MCEWSSSSLETSCLFHLLVSRRMSCCLLVKSGVSQSVVYRDLWRVFPIQSLFKIRSIVAFHNRIHLLYRVRTHLENPWKSLNFRASIQGLESPWIFGILRVGPWKSLNFDWIESLWSKNCCRTLLNTKSWKMPLHLSSCWRLISTNRQTMLSLPWWNLDLQQRDFCVNLKKTRVWMRNWVRNLNWVQNRVQVLFCQDDKEPFRQVASELNFLY